MLRSLKVPRYQNPSSVGFFLNAPTTDFITKQKTFKCMYNNLKIDNNANYVRTQFIHCWQTIIQIPLYSYSYLFPSPGFPFSYRQCHHGNALSFHLTMNQHYSECRIIKPFLKNKILSTAPNHLVRFVGF
jgi:hypothetical protein